MGRRRRHRKRFGCGHRGFGRVCHCCADRERVKRLATMTMEKEYGRSHVVKKKKAKKDGLDLQGFPKAIAQKARGILEKIAQGTEYWKLGGKRLSGERRVIRIPVGYRYRLLCREESDQILPLMVVSHEAYNPLVRRKQGILARLVS